MTVLFSLIYIGGMFATPKEKIGFLSRIYWPLALGAWLHTEARRRGFGQ